MEYVATSTEVLVFRSQETKVTPTKIINIKKVLEHGEGDIQVTFKGGGKDDMKMNRAEMRMYWFILISS